MCQLYKLLGRSEPGITFPRSVSLWGKRTRGPDVTKNTGALNVEKPFNILGNAQNCEMERKQREVQSVPNGLNALASFDPSVWNTLCWQQLVLCNLFRSSKNVGGASHHPHYSPQILSPHILFTLNQEGVVAFLITATNPQTNAQKYCQNNWHTDHQYFEILKISLR